MCINGLSDTGGPYERVAVILPAAPLTDLQCGVSRSGASAILVGGSGRIGDFYSAGGKDFFQPSSEILRMYKMPGCLLTYDVSYGRKPTIQVPPYFLRDPLEVPCGQRPAL